MTTPDRDSVPEFARIRLCIEAPLGEGGEITLGPEQSHYLASVMRRRAGESVRLFNGRDGEWAAEIREAGKRAVHLVVRQQTRAQDQVPDVTLAFAPIKKAPMGYLVEKATELGVRRLAPVITRRTQRHELNAARLAAHAREAAEQSWRLSVPEILGVQELDDFVAGLPAEGRLLYCDERRGEAAPEPALAALRRFSEGPARPWTILIGPEGGFAPEEQALLEGLPGAVAVSLGPRIVRAETAAVMALTLWQSALGDLKAP